MQIVIDTRQCPCRTLSEECGISGYECYEDDICSTCPLIRNGGVELPKGHGRLIDADKTISKICGGSCGCHLEECGHDEPCYSVARINSAPTITEADTVESDG